MSSETCPPHGSYTLSPPVSIETHSTSSFNHSNEPLTPESNGSIEDDRGDSQTRVRTSRPLHLPPLQTTFEDEATDDAGDEDVNEADRPSSEDKSEIYDDYDDDYDGYESNGEVKSSPKSGRPDYSLQEESEVVKQFDRRLVLFLALLYLLSFLDRSSKPIMPNNNRFDY